MFLQIRDIRNEGRDLKDEFTKRLQQTSKEVNQFSEDVLTNLANLDGLFRTGEELSERSSDAEVIRDYKQLKQELTNGVQDKAMESNFVMRRLFLKKGRVQYSTISKNFAEHTSPAIVQYASMAPEH